MRFFVFLVSAVCVPNKKRQIVFIDLRTPAVIIFPDKAGFVPVFANRILPQKLLIFVDRIQIEYKNASGIQIIIDERKYFQQILFFGYVIHGVAYAHNCPNRAIKLKCTHILIQI